MRYGLIAAATVAALGTAHADRMIEFRDELQAGIDAYRAAHYDEARAHLLRARLLVRNAPEPHRYLAVIAQAQASWQECIARTREALALEPNARETPTLRRLNAMCRTGAGLPEFIGELGDGGAITVTTNVPAVVRVRGQPFGGTPISPRAVRPGRVAIDIERSGYQTVKLDIDVLPGIVTDVRVNLELGEDHDTSIAFARRTGRLVLANRPTTLVVDGALTPLPADNALPLTPGMHRIEIREPGKEAWVRRVAISADQDFTLTPVLTDSNHRESRRSLGRGLAIGGSAMVGIGLLSFYMSQSAADAARSILATETSRPIGDTTPPFHTRSDFEDQRTSAHRWSVVSTVSNTLGLAALGTGIYFLIKSRAPSDDEPPGFAVTPIKGGAMIARSVAW